MVNVDVDEASGVKVMEHHDGGVVDEVHQHGREDGACHPEHVAEHQSEDKSWEEAEEVHVESRENKGCNDDGDMYVFE